MTRQQAIDYLMDFARSLTGPTWNSRLATSPVQTGPIQAYKAKLNAFMTGTTFPNNVQFSMQAFAATYLNSTAFATAKAVIAAADPLDVFFVGSWRIIPYSPALAAPQVPWSQFFSVKTPVGTIVQAGQLNTINPVDTTCVSVMDPMIANASNVAPLAASSSLYIQIDGWFIVVPVAQNIQG